MAKSEPGKAQASARKERGIIDGATELLGLGFIVPGYSCRYFDSEFQLNGHRNVVLSILSLGNSISTTRLIPMFTVPGLVFPSSTVQLRGSDFAYNDGGGGVVPVSGSGLRVGVCNDSALPIRYTHLTVYRPAIGQE
jgi:hypothetical protein